jgi:hypothetical protein
VSLRDKALRGRNSRFCVQHLDGKLSFVAPLLPSTTRRTNFGGPVKSFFREFLQLCRQEKKWWLIPLLALLLLGLAAVFILASNSGISWALYPSK